MKVMNLRFHHSWDYRKWLGCNDLIGNTPNQGVSRSVNYDVATGVINSIFSFRV